MAFNETTCLIIGALRGPDAASWGDGLHTRCSQATKLQQLCPWPGPEANTVALSNGTRVTQICAHTCLAQTRLIGDPSVRPIKVKVGDVRPEFGTLFRVEIFSEL